jgi:hypothetical protein
VSDYCESCDQGLSHRADEGIASLCPCKRALDTIIEQDAVGQIRHLQGRRNIKSAFLSGVSSIVWPSMAVR